MKSKKYYSLIADNGFMVANSWDRVLEMQRYFRGNREKGYKSREDAIIAAITGFNERHEHIKYQGEVVVNKPYFTKDFTTTPKPTSMVVFQD
jgi:hypothetical protein